MSYYYYHGLYIFTNKRLIKRKNIAEPLEKQKKQMEKAHNITDRLLDGKKTAIHFSYTFDTLRECFPFAFLYNFGSHSFLL